MKSENIVKNTPSIHEGSLILVNAEHPYQAGSIQLSSVKPCCGQVLLEDQAARALMELLGRTDPDGELICVSGYRPHQEQVDLYAKSLKENGEEFTRKYVARPGCSEHECGLAIDMGLSQDDLDFIRPSFPGHGTAQTFREEAAKSGFIERYIEEKTKLTGIAAEEWHFRYVGLPHSLIMASTKYCLEEYLDFLKDYPFSSSPLYFEGWTIGYVPFEEGLPEFDPDEEVVISGNNCGGWIITQAGQTG